MRTISIVFLASVTLLFASCNKKDDSIKLFPIQAGEKWGYVDNKGQYAINAQFKDAYNFSEGLALVQSTDGKYGYIGEDGKYVINPIYKNATGFSEGLACVVMENGKLQFIDKDNKILFTVDQADFCGGFKEGRARVKVKGKWGFIDKTGTMVVSPIYEDAGHFSEGLAPVAKKVEGKDDVLWGYIDASGGVEIDFQFVADTGKFFCEPQEFSEGLAFVSSNGKEWGCIDKDGKYQINPQFEGRDVFPWSSPLQFRNGLALISQGGNLGYIDRDGKYAVNPQFTDAMRFAANGMAAVQNSDEKWGFINMEGKYEVNPQFDGIAVGYFGDVAFVEVSDKYGIVDVQGRYVLNPQFDAIRLYDLNQTRGVQSDYVDYEGLAKQLFVSSSRTEYLGYSKSTTLSDVIEDYPDLHLSSLDLYKLEIDTPKVDLGEFVEVSTMRIGFDGKTYTETPMYNTVRKWDSYYQTYYNEREFDRMEKKIQSTVPVAWLGHGLVLDRSGKGKGRAFADALKQEAAHTLGVSEVTDLGVENTDFKGIFALESEELVVFIRYDQEEGDASNPSCWITVVNSLYDEPFEEVKNDMVRRFKEE